MICSLIRSLYRWKATCGLQIQFLFRYPLTAQWTNAIFFFFLTGISAFQYGMLSFCVCVVLAPGSHRSQYFVVLMFAEDDILTNQIGSGT